MTRKSLVLSLAAMVLAAGLSARADTFNNNQTAELLYGFRTLKTTADKTLVYNENEKKLSPIKLDDYEVTLDNNGRRNSVVLVSITDAEALLSQTVTKTICDAITKAANSGPRFVLVKIDCPGGRGEYMKEICSTLTKIDICPTVAYISGGPFGGAHSAAAAIALACDRIYIAPNATMSALGPFVSTSSGHSEMDFLKIYSPDSLATYSVFAATLAENKKRPGILAKALLDKRIGLVEVVDTSGNQTVVQKDALLSNQTVVKTLCEGLAPSSTVATDTTTAAVPQPSSVAAIHSRVLQLNPCGCNSI
jgi:membrane-bound ClpP family serine protease